MKNKQKLTNIRYGGIILAIRDDIAKHVKTINTDAKYYGLNLKTVVLCVDVLCGIVYTPPEGSKYVTTDCFRIRRGVN